MLHSHHYCRAFTHVAALAVALVCTQVTSGRSKINVDVLLRTLNDASASWEDRNAAEKELISAHDAAALSPIFEAVVSTIQVGDAEHRLPDTVSLNPGTGSGELDAKVLPVEAQIAYSRLRVWDSYVRNAEPLDERRQILVQLYDRAYGQWTDRTELNWNLKFVIDALSWHENWSPMAEERIRRLFQSASAPYAAEVAARVLLQNGTSDYFEMILDRAWANRHSPEGERLAFMLGRRFDTRLVQMHLDRIDRLKSEFPADLQGNRTMYAALSSLARYYGLDQNYGCDAFAPAPERGLERYSSDWFAAFGEAGLEWVDEHRADMLAGRFKPEWAVEGP